MKSKNSSKSKKEDSALSKADEEKMKILSKTDEVKGEQLTLTGEGVFEKKTEFQSFISDGNIENPERKFDVYYNGIQKLLIKYLPRGTSNKAARKFIYEEKNTFLTRGKRIKDDGRRGADGRMGYISDAEEIFKIVTNWIESNGTMVELFTTLRELNVSKGYGTAMNTQ